MATSTINANYAKTMLASGVSTNAYRYGHIGWMRFSINDTVQTLLAQTIPTGFRPREACYITVTLFLSVTNKYYLGRAMLETTGKMRFFFIDENRAEVEITTGGSWFAIGSGAYVI